MNTAERISLNGNDWKMKEFVGMDWVWRDSVKPDTGDVRWWYPATVPGSVMHDLAANGMIPDPHYECNTKLGEWACDRTWVYRREIFVPKEAEGRKVGLCFDGIDYASEIFVNGCTVGKQEGMYIPWSCDVSGHLLYGKTNLIAVVIEPAPFEQPQVGRTSLVYTNKSRMTYWWDFCPRMVHQGIWQDAYLKITGEAEIRDWLIDTRLVSGEEAKVTVQVWTHQAGGCTYRLSFGEQQLTGVAGQDGFRCEFVLREPRLWWCNGQGEAYEYEVRLELYDRQQVLSDIRTARRGIREIEFVQNEDAAGENTSFLLRLNGRNVFMNGYNWVPADLFYGAVSTEKVAHLIRLAKKAGINVFRVWGGGLIERDSFYEMCARAGILVWQEFCLSSSGIDNKPSWAESYRKLLEEQAEVIVKLKRNHTALAVWCGGNELKYDDGTPIDENDPLIKVIGNVVHRLDPRRKWLPSSPSGGVFLNSFENLEKYPDKMCDVHGPWEHQGLERHYALYNKGTCLMHSEFGVEGMTSARALYRNVAPEHLLPASKDNPVYFHRGAWWNNEPLVQKTFGGDLTDVEQIRRASQYMQYEGLKYAMECNRRRAFHCSGMFPWQFNEPYPNLFCTSALDYYGNPKPVYYGVRKVYAPWLVNAAFDSASLAGRKELRAVLFAANNLPGTAQHEKAWTEGYSVTAQLWTVKGRLLKEESYSLSEVGVRACEAGSFCWELEETPHMLVLLRLRLKRHADESVLAENEYLFTLSGDLGEVFRTEQPVLRIEKEEGAVRITNVGEIAALYVFLKKEEGAAVYWEDDYLNILPGEERLIRAEGDLEQAEAEALNLGGGADESSCGN